MIFDIVTLFPGMFAGPLQHGVVSRASSVAVRLHDLRRWGVGSQRQVDDNPYGGGGGMILKPEPLFHAVEWIRERYPTDNDRIVLLSPQGSRLTHDSARRLASHDRLVLLCGRYEGVDERVREGFVDEEISVGDYVLTGGEIPAAAVIDAVARLLPGVLGNEDSAVDESFSTGLLDYPHYTRPPEFRGMRVPEVLLSGDHEKIRRWRRQAALERTRERRGDLLDRAELSEEEIRSLGPPSE